MTSKMTLKSLGRSVGTRINYGNEASFRAFMSQRCSFSSSTAFRKASIVPSFIETSSPELNDILSTYRSDIFLPAYLSKPLQLLVRKEKSKKALEDDPITVHIGEEPFRLKYIETSKRPRFRVALMKIMYESKTTEEWNNLIPFLTGNNTSDGRSLSLRWKLIIAQHAGKRYNFGVLLECARKVEDTDFSLREHDLVTEIAWHAQRMAFKSKWEAGTTQKALSVVEEMAYMLEDERHCGGYKINKDDPRTRPELIGILLQLSASLAVKKDGGKDVNGSVKKYAERLRAVMEGGEEIIVGVTHPVWGDDYYFLSRVCPVIHGMRVAREVLQEGSALWYWLKAQEAVLMDAAETSYNALIEKVEAQKQKKAEKMQRREEAPKAQEAVLMDSAETSYNAGNEREEARSHGYRERARKREEAVIHGEAIKLRGLLTYEWLLSTS